MPKPMDLSPKGGFVYIAIEMRPSNKDKPMMKYGATRRCPYKRVDSVSKKEKIRFSVLTFFPSLDVFFDEKEIASVIHPLASDFDGEFFVPNNLEELSSILWDISLNKTETYRIAIGWI